MSGRFFDDILEDSDKRMGLDPYEDPNDGGGSWTDWCMKLKAEPKKDVKMSAQKEWQSDGS